MNLIKIKTPDGWVVLYKALFESFLSKDDNLADLTDVSEALKNLGLVGDVTSHNHDSQYLSLIQEKYDELNNKIKDLENKLEDQKHNFFTVVEGDLLSFLRMANGWYIWKGTISNVTGTWLIRKAGTENDINYAAYNIEDPRVALSSSNLNEWYSPYGYWHA